MLKPSFLLLSLAGLLSACASQPLPKQEAPDLPETWAALPASETTQALNLEWWQGFDSEELNQLIARALVDNPDLAMAYQRLRQAEARWGVSRVDQLPQLQGSASAGVSQRSSSASASQSSENSSLGLSASYEVDLWGRVAAASRASEASFQASSYDWQAAQISLAASVAETWFQWLTLNERLALAEALLEKREEQGHLVRVQQHLGVVSEEERLRQENQLRNQQQLVASLEIQRQASHQALALLLGVSAQALEAPSTELMHLALPYPQPGLPVELLTRRPDLASTEARLEAGAANVELARKAFLPGFQLGASASLASNSLGLSDPVSTLGLTASLSQMIFDGGRRNQQVTLAIAQQLELLESYRSQALTALSEAETALYRLQQQQYQEARQQQQAAAEQELLRLANSRYQAGSSAYSQLLEAEISWLQQQETLKQERQALLQQLVEVYRALGGGWQHAG